jgi:hypothetical protein
VTCCQPLQHVTEDIPEAQRDGLMFETPLNMSTGKQLKTRLVLHFRRGRQRAWVDVNFCPFCGKKLRK